MSDVLHAREVASISDIPDMIRSLRQMRDEISTISKRCTAILKTQSQMDKTKNIIKAVCEHYGCTKLDLTSDRRDASIIIPRHMTMYLCRYLTTLSLVDVGRALGGKDHSTICYGIEMIEKKRVVDMHIAASVSMLTEMFSA